MNPRNIFLINKLLYVQILLFFLVGCKEGENSFINELGCKPNNDLKTLINDFSSFMSESNEFFTVIESKGQLYIEPYNINYSYKERSIKLTYFYTKNHFLVDEKIEDISKLDSIVKNKVRAYFVTKGIAMNKETLERHRNQNSGLLFEISDFSKEDVEISKDQSYSMLLLLNKLNCSIDNARRDVSKTILKKKYDMITQQEKEMIDNMIPKIYYVSYLKNYKVIMPVPVSPINK
ncbi:hypothetical protein [Aquimarina aquimarini]|uniref:hypothetical protein n=1 Tax=Aquimarina aquimarini TaxID=1191734 RepID=UPI001F29A960|nr:hypothetical protein [Aquimarina aquimarini]